VDQKFNEVSAEVVGKKLGALAPLDFSKIYEPEATKNTQDSSGEAPKMIRGVSFKKFWSPRMALRERKTVLPSKNFNKNKRHWRSRNVSVKIRHRARKS